MTAKVLIGAGHKNTDGGNPFERELNGKKVKAIFDRWRALGALGGTSIDLRSYTPQEGLGEFPGGLQAAPASGFKSDWIPDVMVELHSEGVGSDLVRGGFVIYPDFPGGGDVDGDVHEFGEIFPRLLNNRSSGKIAIRPALTYPEFSFPAHAGIMSERQTGVGLQGFRLGVFFATFAHRDFTTRLIFEQGAHSNPIERNYMESPLFLPIQAQAFLDAMSGFLDKIKPGWTSTPAQPPQTPIPNDSVLFKDDVYVTVGHYSAIDCLDNVRVKYTGPLTTESPQGKFYKTVTDKAFNVSSFWVNKQDGTSYYRTPKGYWMHAEKAVLIP